MPQPLHWLLHPSRERTTCTQWRGQFGCREQHGTCYPCCSVVLNPHTLIAATMFLNCHQLGWDEGACMTRPCSCNSQQCSDMQVLAQTAIAAHMCACTVAACGLQAPRGAVVSLHGQSQCRSCCESHNMRAYFPGGRHGIFKRQAHARAHTACLTFPCTFVWPNCTCMRTLPTCRHQRRHPRHVDALCWW